MRQSDRFARQGERWITSTGYAASDREAELLNEIELLNWELEIVKTKLNQMIASIDA